MLEVLAANLPVLMYSPGATRTFVATTYLDSRDHDYLGMAERSQGQLSLKVRVREYIQLEDGDGVARLSPSASCYLERKERVGQVRVKQRIELAKAEVGPVLRREVELPGDHSVVRALKAELNARKLEPVLVSGYLRSVFGTEDGLRVTFDEQLGFHVPPENLYEGAAALTPEVLGTPIARGPAHILEVKEPSGIDSPGWLSQLLGEIEPSDHFSKFRAGMSYLTPTSRVRVSG